MTADDGRAPDPELIAAKRSLIAAHLEGPVASEPWVQAVEHDASIPRWYVRFGTETRDAATIYFDLHQRSLHHELYYLPDPPRRHEELYRYLLGRNHASYGAHFSIGPDGDVYLVGRTLLEHLDEAELDRVVGTLYQLVEATFPTAVRLAFGRD